MGEGEGGMIWQNGIETGIINRNYIIYEMNCQSRFNAWNWMLGVVALGRPRGMVQGGRKEGGFRMGTRVYLWQIHVDVWKTNIIL